MERTFAAAVAASILLLAAGAVAGVYLGGSGLFDERQRVDAAVTSFSAENVTCLAPPSPDPTVTAGNASKGTFLILRTNVTLGDGETRPTNATIEKNGLANYTLSIEESAVEDDPVTCPAGKSAVVPTQIYVQVPHRGGESFGVTVTYDGDRLFRIQNGIEGARIVNVEHNGE